MSFCESRMRITQARCKDSNAPQVRSLLCLISPAVSPKVQRIILCGVSPGRLQLTSMRFQRHLAVSSGIPQDLEPPECALSSLFGAQRHSQTQPRTFQLFLYDIQLRHVTRLRQEPCLYPSRCLTCNTSSPDRREFIASSRSQACQLRLQSFYAQKDSMCVTKKVGQIGENTPSADYLYSLTSAFFDDRLSVDL